MKIFVTGVTGYIGGSVAVALRAQGHAVRGMTRDHSRSHLLQAAGIEPVIGTLDESDLLAREAAGADAVINAANSDHAGAVEALVQGLAGSDKPLIHTSGCSVVGDDARGLFRSELIVDEATPLTINPAKQARRDIDVQVLAAADRQVRSTVICPSLIYGQGRGLNPHSVQIPFLLAHARVHGAIPVVGNGSNVWSNVHIDDVVQLYLLALAKAPAGSFYFAENGEASYAELAQALAERTGIRRVEYLPAEVAAQHWGEPRAYFSFGSNCRVRAIRARRELGWLPQHRSVQDWIAQDGPDVDSSIPSI